VLGGLPLAIVHAPSWIRGRKFSQYYEKLVEKEKPSYLHSYFWKDPRKEHSQKIAPTVERLNSVFELSFNELEAGAKKLMFIFAHLENDGIPEEMTDRWRRAIGQAREIPENSRTEQILGFEESLELPKAELE
jgi:hypothetical protein